MDAKDLRTETAHSERSSDGNTNFAPSVPTFQSADKNKSYHDIGSNSLPKVDVPTTRPCAVIGPDRILPPPLPAADSFVKRGLVEPWQFTRPPEYPHKMPEYPHKMPEYPHKMPEYPHKLPDYQQQLTRNISPRQTFQENMPRIMVPPVRYNPVKAIEDPTFPTDKNISSKNVSKLNMPSEPKYCDVPYTVNPLTNEHKSVRKTELPVSNVDSVLLRSASHTWPPSGVNVQPPRGCGPSELYHCPEYSSCVAPRTIPMNRPHRTGHEEALPMYPDSYYRGGNIRFEPYPTAKDRYQLPPRYDYTGNYSSPYNPPHFPSQKYEMQKLPSSAMPTHPYPGYPQVPLKYLEKMRGDGYQRSTNPQPNYGVPFHNQGMHPNYGPVPGNYLQNKLYSYPADASAHAEPHAKPTYETNKSYGLPSKHYQAPNNYYLNELAGSHHMKPQMAMPNYPAMNMHPVPPYPYYRKDTMPYKNFDFPTQYKNADPLNYTQYQRIPSQFSPNIISPMESHASDHAFSVSPEDCGYVSQSSTTSIRSTDSSMNRYKVYDPRYGLITRGSPLASRMESDSKTMSSKEKKNIDLRQFLQSWNEGDEEHGESNANKEILHPNSSDPKQYEVVNNQEQLYVLGLVNVPSEELDKYEHIQKVSKLPDNIKGYTSIDLLNQFEEAIESSKINNRFPSRTPESKVAKPSIKTNAQMPANLTSRPLSPLDVEAKISQSVIHKEVGCNFELRPCSPKMMNVEVAAPVQNVSGERVIEKFANPLIVKSPSMLPIIEENCNIVNRQNRRRSLSRDNTPNVPSCKMVKTQYSPETSMESKKSSYSIQDLESNSGVCLASLPRLDNDIELSFPEVNQQFINANKAESTTSLSSDNLPSLDIDDSGSLISKQNTERKDAHSYPFSPSEEFSKLSKYRKLRTIKESIDDTVQKIAKPIRTDSVIIKNPENCENMNMAEEKLNLCVNEVETFAQCNDRLAATLSPMNLAMQENSLVGAYGKSGNGMKVKANSVFSETADTALNLILTSCSKISPAKDVHPETHFPAESLDTSEDFLATDLSTNKDKKVDLQSSIETKEPIGKSKNNGPLIKNDCNYSELRDKHDDDEELLSLEQERRRQSLSLEAQLTPMSEDTSSDDSDSETDDASETKINIPDELDLSKTTLENTFDIAETKEFLTIADCKDGDNFQDENKNDAKHELSTAVKEPKLQLSSKDNSPKEPSDSICDFKEPHKSISELSKSETTTILNNLNDVCQDSTVLIAYEQKPNMSTPLTRPITNISGSVRLDHESDDSDSLSDSETSSSESTSETEQCSNSDNDEDLCDEKYESSVKTCDLKTDPKSLGSNNLESSSPVDPSELSKPSSENEENENSEKLHVNSESLNLRLVDTANKSERDQCTKTEISKIVEDDTLKINVNEITCAADNLLPADVSASNIIVDTRKCEDQLSSCAYTDISTIPCGNDIDVSRNIPTDCTSEKCNGLDRGICHKISVPFYKELFCAVFQHLILEEGWCVNNITDSKLVTSDSITNYDTDKTEKTSRFQGTAQKTPTDLVEEHLERIHASDTSVQDSSDETEENVGMDLNELDLVNEIGSEGPEKNENSKFCSEDTENELAGTEKLISSLEDPQHVNKNLVRSEDKKKCERSSSKPEKCRNENFGMDLNESDPVNEIGSDDPDTNRNAEMFNSEQLKENELTGTEKRIFSSLSEDPEQANENLVRSEDKNFCEISSSKPEKCTEKNFGMDINEDDPVNEIGSDEPDTNRNAEMFHSEQSNETELAGTEKRISSLSEDPQRVNENLISENKNFCERSSSKPEKCTDENFGMDLNESDPVNEIRSDEPDTKRSAEIFNSDQLKENELVGTEKLIYSRSEDTQHANENLVKSEDKNVCERSTSKPEKCTLLTLTNNSESSDNCQLKLEMLNEDDNIEQCENHVLKTIRSVQPENIVIITNTDKLQKEPLETCQPELELPNGKGDVTSYEYSGTCQTFDICIPRTLKNNFEGTICDNRQPESELHNNIENVTHFKGDGIIKSSVLCQSDDSSIPQTVKDNLEETSCDNSNCTVTVQVDESELHKNLDIVKNLEDDDVLDKSSLCQPGDPTMLPILTNKLEKTRDCCQSGSEMHDDIDSETHFEDCDVFESPNPYYVKNFSSPPTYDPNDVQVGSSNRCQPEEETKNLNCEKCSVQIEQKHRISDFDLNNPRGYRRTTKRSLSESAIYSNSHLAGKENFQLEEFCWSKRKKLVDSNIIQETNSPLLTCDNLSNLMQSRRNSISSFYHDENGTFCILIDNDCIIAQDEFDQEAICFADIPEENFSTVVDNHILAVNEERRTIITLDRGDMDGEGTEFVPEDNVAVSLSPENIDENTVEESWVEDVACVETVVSEYVVDDGNVMYGGTSIISPNYDDTTCDSDKSDLDMFTTNDHADKIKHIYGNEMCSSQSINLIKTLYTTPQMDVKKTLNVTESLILESTKRIDHVETLNSTPTIYDESSCDSKVDDTDTASNYDPNHLAPDIQGIQDDNNVDDALVSNNATKEDGVFEEIKELAINKALTSPDILNKAQDNITPVCESSNDEAFHSQQTDDSCKYKRSSSSPEVSSTTEEKKSAILLKITNYKGSRISHINNVDIDNNRKIRCKFTEENDYRSNLTSSRPLITKAAQKYIPPLKETTINDLKVKLFLPEQSLLKLKEIKMSKEQPKMDVQRQIKAKPTVKITKMESNKKVKPKFEDVLKSIDEIQIKMHKEKSKKVDKAVPKVIIKKNGNGSHYASSSGREIFNPDMTGRKWQPWVFLEKHKFIDNMAMSGKTRAVFCHRKGTYIWAENFKKYRSMGSNKFIISQPKADSPSGPLKYTIKLKQVY